VMYCSCFYLYNDMPVIIMITTNHPCLRMRYHMGREARNGQVGARPWRLLGGGDWP
jgi:hypothetical protein